MKTLRLSFLLLLLFFTTINLRAEHYPKRIISLSPSITEIIYAIGAWDKLVGVSMYSDYPPEAHEIEQVGGWVNPNLEAILKLKPDLVIMLTDQDKIFGDKLRALSLNTLTVDSNPSIEHIARSINDIGYKIGETEQSDLLVNQINTAVDQIKSKTKNISPKKVLCVIGRSPGTLDDIYVVGNTSYINELITLAGGINVIQKERTALKISKEAIFALDPDYIIEINHDKTDNLEEIMEIWSIISEARAVKSKQVRVISSTAILHPSQRVIEGMRQLLAILHPEVLS